MILKPPLVEPEEPPIKNKRKMKNWDTLGQAVKSAVAKPLVELIESA